MKSRKELEKELENISYRYKSLADISNRREILPEEKEELETLEIRVNDLNQILKQKNSRSLNKYSVIGKTLTLLTAILFIMLTIYTTLSAYQFMNHNVSIDKQVMMGFAIIVTFVSSVGTSYAFTRQLKLI